MRTSRIAGLMFALATVVSAQVGTVENAAVYQPTILGGRLGSAVLYAGFLIGFPAISANTVSPRMLAVLTYPGPQLISNGPIPLSPPPVSATLFLRPVGSSTPTQLIVTNAVAGAITFVVPAGVPVGGAELLYQIDNQPTQWTDVNVVQSSFEFFRIGSGGPAIAQTRAANGSLTNVGLATPVQPGQTLLLTGSGLGYGSTVSATIGGVPAPLIYAGAHPTQAGRDEILLQVPQGVPDGCYVPLALTYNQTTVTTTISETSDGSPCKHAWQLAVNDMKTLDSGGALTGAAIDLSTQLNVVTSTVASRNESASMSFNQITAAGIASYFTPISGPSCTALSPALGIAAFRNGDFAVLLPAPPDLGATVTLQSPATTITLSNNNGPFYSSQSLPPTDGAPPVIVGGKWTWQSSGGKDLPASSFGFTLPAPIQLNGGAPISLRRNQDQTITWNGAAFDAGATVHIDLSGTAGLVSCIAPAGTGTVTIPSSMLSGYAANTIGTLTATLNESGSFLPHAQFQLRSGNTLLMFVSFSSSDSRPAAFQ